MKPVHATEALLLIVSIAIGLAIGQRGLAQSNQVNVQAVVGSDPCNGLVTSAKPDTKMNRAVVRESFGRNDLGAIERLRAQGIEMTQAELEETFELSQRRQNGEYVLLFERPLSRKADERARKDLVEELNQNNSAEYDRMFRDFGLTAEASEQLKLHASKIARASLEAEAAIHQLLRARNDYDAAIHSRLSAEDYARYRKMEAGRPALRELEKIDVFYRNRVGKSVGLEYRNTIVRLIQEAQNYTDSVTYYRPYDESPGIIVGHEAVLRSLERKTAHLSNGLQQILEGAGQSRLPEEYNKLLAQYFDEEIRKMSKGIESLRQRRAKRFDARPAPGDEAPTP